MLATAHKMVQRLARALTLAAVGGGILPALIVALGHCPVSGSPGC